jgi:predicted ATP-dependent endonuclease of OLD family
MFASISIDNEVFSDYEVFEKKIINLSKINVFIGTNNSGKSRFLRKLFVDDSAYSYEYAVFNVANLNSQIDRIKLTIEQAHAAKNPFAVGLLPLLENLKKYSRFTNKEDFLEIRTFFDNLNRSFGSSKTHHPLQNKLRDPIDSCKSAIYEDIDKWKLIRSN